MRKVRWSQYCAGGCGTFLLVGHVAEHMHRGLWCGYCAFIHRSGCDAHPEPVVAVKRDTLQPALW